MRKNRTVRKRLVLVLRIEDVPKQVNTLIYTNIWLVMVQVSVVRTTDLQERSVNLKGIHRPHLRHSKLLFAYVNKVAIDIVILRLCMH